MLLNHDPGLAEVIGLPQLRRPKRGAAVTAGERTTPSLTGTATSPLKAPLEQHAVREDGHPNCQGQRGWETRPDPHPVLLWSLVSAEAGREMTVICPPFMEGRKLGFTQTSPWLTVSTKGLHLALLTLESVFRKDNGHGGQS